MFSHKLANYQKQIFGTNCSSIFQTWRSAWIRHVNKISINCGIRNWRMRIVFFFFFSSSSNEKSLHGVRLLDFSSKGDCFTELHWIGSDSYGYRSYFVCLKLFTVLAYVAAHTSTCAWSFYVNSGIKNYSLKHCITYQYSFCFVVKGS